MVHYQAIHRSVRGGETRRLQLGTCCTQLVTQFSEVLNDPIMDDRHRARTVRMRIINAWCPVCRPTRVADTTLRKSDAP